MGCLKFCEDKYFLFVGSETKVIFKMHVHNADGITPVLL